MDRASTSSTWVQASVWYAQGLRPVGSKRADFNAQIQRETATRARLIREAGVEAK